MRGRGQFVLVVLMLGMMVFAPLRASACAVSCAAAMASHSRETALTNGPTTGTMTDRAHCGMAMRGVQHLSKDGLRVAGTALEQQDCLGRGCVACQVETRLGPASASSRSEAAAERGRLTATALVTVPFALPAGFKTHLNERASLRTALSSSTNLSLNNLRV